MKHIKAYTSLSKADVTVSSLYSFLILDIASSILNWSMNWVDDDWSDDHDSEYDWYVDHNNGEAQDVIIDDIIKWYKSQINIRLDVMNEIELSDAIKQEYSCLFY